MHERCWTLRAELVAGTAALLLAASCGSDLGECDMNALGGSNTAPLVAHDGQRLIQDNCASSRCHTADAKGEFRTGAPADLNFDLIQSEDSTAERVKVLEGQERVREFSDEMWEQIEDGNMPPPPPAGMGELAKADKEKVRNWLACGAPVVAEVPPPSSGGTDWISIYDDLIGKCVGCHGPDAAMVAGGGFDLANSDDPCTAYDHLVGTAASGSGCSTSGLTLVVANQPDQSLLLNKLSERMPPCGSYMPMIDDRPLAESNPELVGRLRTWIMDGALEPAECQ